MKVMHNVSPILFVQKPCLTGESLGEAVNAVVVEGKAYTVGHFPQDTPYTVIDPPTLRHALAQYAEADRLIDSGVLNIKCTGTSYERGELGEDPGRPQDVMISWITTTTDGRPAMHNVRGKINGAYYDGRCTKIIISVERMQKPMCGAAATDPGGKKLYGIINAGELRRDGTTDTLYMTRILGGPMRDFGTLKNGRERPGNGAEIKNDI